MFRTDFNDKIDVQQAFADFERIQKYSLKPVVVPAGEQVQGDIVLARNLSENSAQNISLNVHVDTDLHTFNFRYLKTD